MTISEMLKQLLFFFFSENLLNWIPTSVTLKRLLFRRRTLKVALKIFVQRQRRLSAILGQHWWPSLCSHFNAILTILFGTNGMKRLIQSKISCIHFLLWFFTRIPFPSVYLSSSIATIKYDQLLASYLVIVCDAKYFGQEKF